MTSWWFFIQGILLVASRTLVGSNSHHDCANDRHGCVKMGVPRVDCDDGQHNVKTDWDPQNSEPYTCSGRKDFPVQNVPNKLEKNMSEHNPYHMCLNQTINYQEKYGDPLPTSGAHRPLWPVYGTYLYAPPQRWIHSLEHGAIVALYHPCAKTSQVRLLRNLVKSCLSRHVITPSKELTSDRPFALYAWQNRLVMNRVTQEEVIQFIRTYAYAAPEKVSMDGQYKIGLILPAPTLPQNPVCPGYP